MNLRSPLRRAVALVSLCSYTACYVERPLGSTVPAPETHVVAQVTDQGTVDMANLIGSGATAVEGVVTAADAASWELSLLKVRNREGQTVSWNRERVVFPRAVLTNARERNLDTTRSWIAAGAVLAGAILAAAIFDVVGGGSGGDSTPIPPAQILRPGFGIP
jgi:hypothetical protein